MIRHTVPSQPERLFDRQWRPGHPFGPAQSCLRRWGMLALFLLLCFLIGGYLFVTDADRVRAKAEDYLSSLVRAHVRVGSASLSIFEGLRLENVQVYVDDRPDEAPDSTLFSAELILIKYDPRVLLGGRLEASQILAIEPHVRLTENLDTGRWNYQRMFRPPEMPQPPGGMPRPLILPEILLRSAQIDYSEVSGGQQRSLGSLAIEGRLSPAADGSRYFFEAQSRGFASETVGPVVTGSFSRDTGQVVARLQRFDFGRDVRSMLPAQVRHWWEQHGLSGRLDVPLLSYTPAAHQGPGAEQRGGQAAHFRVEMELDGVTLAAVPEEWMSREELSQRESARRVFERLHRLSRGGLAFSAMPVGPFTMPDYAQRMLETLSLEPVRLRRVSGRFIFTDNGIEIDQMSGRLENNAFTINGQIRGYSPLAPADVTIRSSRTENIYIPPAPKYVSSMPRPVRKIYDLFKPQGTCALMLRLVRPESGARPEVSGRVDVVDGSFVFEKFPYPVRRATGAIVFGRDERTGQDRLDIVEIQGRGIDGGPNADARLSIRGSIAPLTPEMAVNVRIAGDDISSEPALTSAFPPEVRQALEIFDPTGTGAFPKFHGGFSCDVLRPPGPRQKFAIHTDITLDDASGAFRPFPYPLEHVTGKLSIREGYVDIIDAGIQRGDATLKVNGRVSWTKPATQPVDDATAAVHDRHINIKPELTITARNVPIDPDFLAALPPDRRQWLEKVGLRGSLDIDGQVYRKEDAGEASAAAPDDPKGIAATIGHEFDIKLRDGRLWPVDGTYAFSDLTGSLHLTPDRLVITELKAHRGRADLTGQGTISWPGNHPHIALSGSATNLLLDEPLYHLLPQVARRAWDEVRPEGVVDLDVSYTGQARSSPPSTQPGNDSRAADQPATTPAPPSQLELTIRPRQLAATLKAVPYRLEEITGAVNITGPKVHLQDLAARHGEARVHLSGTGMFPGGGPEGSRWELKLQGDDVPVDEAFRSALPEALSDLADALKLQGTLSFVFPRLVVSLPVDEAPTTSATRLATSQRQEPPRPNVDFALELKTPRASMDLGVPLRDVTASVTVAGTVRQGHLNELRGNLLAPSLVMADRPVTDFKASFEKPGGSETLRIAPMRGRIAGGELAGDVDLKMPRVGPSRYALNLVLRDADVKTIAADDAGDRAVNGRLTASVALEGEWSNTSTRRGRGDVSVSGKEMYKIPLVLGLLQITNLALPITSPFNEATVAYSVDGNRVTAERIVLRSRDMLMQGSGYLDFTTRRVRMTFTTDNPNWPKLPIVGEFMRGAKNELLKIRVRGTLQEPKVGATPMSTFSTTIDEVLRGGDEDEN